MQIKTYSLFYLLSYLITFCVSEYYLSFDSYSFDYSPKPCDIQVPETRELLNNFQTHQLLHKFSDDSSVLLSDSSSDAPSEIPSEAPSNSPSEIPSEEPSTEPSEAPLNYYVFIVMSYYFLYFCKYYFISYIYDRFRKFIL